MRMTAEARRKGISVKGGILFSLLSASLLGNLALAYNVVDQAVTIDHCSSQVEMRGRQTSAMESLFPALLEDRSRGGLVAAFNRSGIEFFDKKGEGLVAEDVLFVIEGDQVTGAEFD